MFFFVRVPLQIILFFVLSFSKYFPLLLIYSFLKWPDVSWDFVVERTWFDKFALENRTLENCRNVSSDLLLVTCFLANSCRVFQ